MGEDNPSEFERHAADQPISLPREFFLFLKENKKWWLVPILLVLALLGLLVMVGGSGAAPFIYTLF